VVANLFPDPPVRTPFVGGQPNTPSFGWMKWFQQIAQIFSGTSSSAQAGSSGSLPPTVEGYLTLNVNGAIYKVPFYK